MLHLHTIDEYRVYEDDDGSYYVVVFTQPRKHSTAIQRNLTRDAAILLCNALNATIR